MANDINKQIEHGIQSFVTQLSGLVRDAAMDAVQSFANSIRSVSGSVPALTLLAKIVADQGRFDSTVMQRFYPQGSGTGRTCQPPVRGP